MKQIIHGFTRWGGSLHDVVLDNDTGRLAANVRQLVALEGDLIAFAL
jgi:hypothetical protein